MCDHGGDLLGVEGVPGGGGDDDPTGTTGYAVGRTRGVIENHDVQVVVSVSDQRELTALPDTSGTRSTPGAEEALRSSSEDHEGQQETGRAHHSSTGSRVLSTQQHHTRVQQAGKV